MAAFILTLRSSKHSRDDSEKDADAASSNPLPPSAGYLSGEAPRELLVAWVHFLKADITEAVNTLHNRLNVISHTAAAAISDDLSPEHRKALDRIRSEGERATNITTGLLRRVDALAPDTVPPVVFEFDSSKLPSGRILVVEDDEANRTVVRKVFERLGNKVTAVSNGLEAFAVIDSGGIDCVISDVRLPFADGKTLFQQVEQHVPHMASRFVFVTGDFTNPDTRTFLESTGQPYIGKPYELEALLGAVAVIMRNATINGSKPVVQVDTEA